MLEPGEAQERHKSDQESFKKAQEAPKRENMKQIVPAGPQKRNTAAENYTSGDLVKCHILRKACQNPRENWVSARSLKQGPLAKGNY
tara:strand:- start:37 stop:297 length:261 start_codon:yes stop_codon:yes gene_type:complete